MTNSHCEIMADDARAATRVAMLALVQQLTEDFAGRYDASQVIRAAYRIREELLARGIWLDIVEATETATRRSLRGSRTLVTSPG